MAESLIFSLNSVLPIFIMVILGGILKNRGFLSEVFFENSEKLVFKAALPAMLFLEAAQTDPASIKENSFFILYCSAAIVISFLIPCIVVPVFLKENAKRGAFIQGVYRSNFAILGTTLASNMFGEEGVRQIAMVLPFATILFNVFAVIILSVYAPEDKKLSVRELFIRVLKNVVTNPLIIAVVLAVPFMLTPLSVPVWAQKTLKSLSNLSMPLALMSLGANFRLENLKGRFALALTASSIKTILVPAAAVIPAAALGMRGTRLGAVLILFGGPAAVSSYIMAKSMGSDGELAGQILLCSTLMCTFTMFIGIFLLSYLKLI